METISVVKFRTADGQVFDTDKAAFAHEQALLEKYTRTLCNKLTKEQACILQMITDRNLLNKNAFGQKLSEAVSKECFGITGKWWRYGDGC